MKNQTNGIDVAMVYVGTLIGAGFASGQELFQFFGKFGVSGLIGIGLAGVLLSFVGYAVLRISSTNKLVKAEEIIFPFRCKALKLFMNIFFNLFLFGIVVVMLAGSGAMIYEQFKLKPWIGSCIMMILILLTASTGKKGIIKSFKMVVPFLIIGMLLVIILALANVNWDIMVQSTYNGGGSWIISAILFVSYNMIAAVSVLIPLGREINAKSTAVAGAVAGGLTLGIIGVLAVLSMFMNIKVLAGFEVPLAYLASAVSPKAGIVYSIVLFIGIYTTAVGCLFALEDKLSPTLQVNPKFFNLCILAAALLLCDVGFSKLIETVYSISGYIGLFILAGITANFFKLNTNKH